MSDIVLGIRLTADGKQLAGEIRVSREEFAKLREEVGRNTSEAAKLNNEQKNLAQGLNASANSIGVASAAWSKMFDIVFQAAGALKDYVKEAALLNARHETMGVVLGVVGRNAGYSRGEMELYAESVRKSGITMIESRESVVKMVQSNLDLAIASKLARAAQDAAVIANINSSEAFGRMIHGIQAGQVEILRTMGINVNFEESYKKLARQLKVNVDQLTEQEKTQARANVTLDATVQIMGTYEAAMGTAGKQLSSLARYEENLKVLRGQIFNEALVIAVNNYTDALKGATDEAQRLQTQGDLREWGRNIINTFALVADIVRGAWDVMAQGVESTAVVILQALEKISAVQVGMGLRSAVSHNEMTQYVASFTAIADQNMAARLSRPQMRDTAAGFFAQRDAEAAQKALEGRYDDWGYSPPQTAAGRPGGKKTEGADLRDYVRQLKEQFEITKQASIEEKVLFDLREKHWKNATPRLRQQAIDYARQLDLRKQEEVAAKAAADALDRRTAVQQQAEAIQADFNRTQSETLKQIEFETHLLGLNEREREKAIALRNLENEYDKASVKLKDEDTDAWERRTAAMRRDYEQRKAELPAAIDRRVDARDIQKQIEEGRNAAKQMNEDLQRGLTDSIFRGFEAGKSFARNFRDALVNMFKTTILRPVIQWVVSPITGAITGALGGLGIPGLANAAPGAGGGFGQDLIGQGVSSLLGGSLFSSAGAYAGALGLSSAAAGSQAALLAAQTGVFGSAGLAATASSAGAGFASAALSALPYVGLALGAASLLGAFGGSKGGPAHFTGLDVSGTASMSGLLGSQFTGNSANSKQPFSWQSHDHGATAGINASIAGLFADMTKLAQTLGLDASRLSNAQVPFSFRTTAAGNKGLGPTTEEVIAAFQQNMGQISDALALELMPNLREFAQANESATQTLVRLVTVQEQLRGREQQTLDAMRGYVTGLPDRLGITGLAGFRDSLAVSEFRSPLDRFGSARALLNENYGRAIGGDLAAVQAFPQLAQQLLGIGRDVYASGPQFAEVFVEVNRQLQDVLSQQQNLQTELLRDIDISLVQSAQDQLAEMRRTREVLVEELQNVRAELRRITA